MSDILQALIDDGLLQFGLFGDTAAPFQAHLNLLPAYPDLMHRLIPAVGALIGKADRLLAVEDAMPLGVGLALHSGIPLVYSQGKGAVPVFDFVGAYDIGHRTVLVANILDDSVVMGPIIQAASGVGLNIRTIITVLDLQAVSAAPEGVVVSGLLNLAEMIAYLESRQIIPPGHVQQMRRS